MKSLLFYTPSNRNLLWQLRKINFFFQGVKFWNSVPITIVKTKKVTQLYLCYLFALYIPLLTYEKGTPNKLRSPFSNFLIQIQILSHTDLVNILDLGVLGF